MLEHPRSLLRDLKLFEQDFKLIVIITNNKMRHLKRISLICIFVALSVFLYSQQDCKVLMPELSGTYIGKCKKGLAHGKGKAVGTDTYEGYFRKGLPSGYGIYTSSTGEVYKGKWKKGMKDGEGEFIFGDSKKDSTLVGIWKKDVYIGLKPEKPNVIHKENVDRYSFRRQSDGNRVFIDIFRNGTRNADIEQFRVIGTSGIKTQDEYIVYYEEVVFPFVCKINYKTWNKAHTAQYYVTFEFKITQSGVWKLNIYN